MWEYKWKISPYVSTQTEQWSCSMMPILTLVRSMSYILEPLVQEGDNVMLDIAVALFKSQELLGVACFFLYRRTGRRQEVKL